MENITFFVNTRTGTWKKQLYQIQFVPRVGDKIEFGQMLPLKVKEVILKMSVPVTKYGFSSATIVLDLSSYEDFADDDLNSVLESARFVRTI